MDDRTVRAALNRHWEASDAGDFNVEHEIYREDAVLDYPQSGERIRGRHNIQESRYVQPNKKRFTVRRIIGGGDLWVTEFVLSYDGAPSYVVSMRMRALANLLTISTVAQMPSLTGIRMSMRTRSGLNLSKSSTACAPSCASATTFMSGSVFTSAMRPIRTTK